MAKKKNSTKTHRSFSLITYHTREIIDGILSYRPIRAAAYIFHDRDIKEDGTPKEPHFHILIYTNSPATLQQVINWFPTNQNTFNEVLADPEYMTRYLTHKDNPEKAQYSEQDIVEYGEGLECFRRCANVANKHTATAQDIIHDINTGVSPVEMLRRYGKEYIFQYDKYQKFAAIVRTYESRGNNHAAEQWQKIVDLHDCGVMSDYDFAYYQKQFGGEYNPYLLNVSPLESVTGGELDV